jgi:hypothetical protein
VLSSAGKVHETRCACDFYANHSVLASLDRFVPRLHRNLDVGCMAGVSCFFSPSTALVGGIAKLVRRGLSVFLLGKQNLVRSLASICGRRCSAHCLCGDGGRSDSNTRQQQEQQTKTAIKHFSPFFISSSFSFRDGQHLVPARASSPLPPATKEAFKNKNQSNNNFNT